ncbi:MAG: GAF domain-containing protein [Bacteroidota bacterium]|nr:GAF domain-containing protein [Bacteroidota bacterium]
MEQLIIDNKLINQFKQDKNVENLLRGFLWQLAHATEACQGIIYEVKNGNEGKTEAVFLSSYAYSHPNQKELKYAEGEGFVGQVLHDKKELIISNIPSDYLTIVSGLGKSAPAHIAIIPIKNKTGNMFSIIELASFRSFDSNVLSSISNAEVELYELINS